MEDLRVVEGVCRKDPKVIEQCEILGISPKDMDKVYCDREYIPDRTMLLRSRIQLGLLATTSAMATRSASSRP